MLLSLGELQEKIIILVCLVIYIKKCSNVAFQGILPNILKAPDPALVNFILPSQSIIKYSSMQFEFGKKG